LTRKLFKTLKKGDNYENSSFKSKANRLSVRGIICKHADYRIGVAQTNQMASKIIEKAIFKQVFIFFNIKTLDNENIF